MPKPAIGQTVRINGSRFRGTRYKHKYFPAKVLQVSDFSIHVQYGQCNTKQVLPLSMLN